MIVAMAILELMPNPSQTTSSGASATFGSDLQRDEVGHHRALEQRRAR